MKENTNNTSTPSSPPNEEQEPLIPNQQDDIPVVDAMPVAVAEESAYVPPSLTDTGPSQATISSAHVRPQAVPTSTLTAVVVSSYMPEDLGRSSVKITCPYCRNEGYTRVNQEMSIGTLLWMIFSILIFWPLMFCVCCWPCVSRFVSYCSMSILHY